jgi:hypothetical protein
MPESGVSPKARTVLCRPACSSTRALRPKRPDINTKAISMISSNPCSIGHEILQCHDSFPQTKDLYINAYIDSGLYVAATRLFSCQHIGVFLVNQKAFYILSRLATIVGLDDRCVAFGTWTFYPTNLDYLSLPTTK